MKKYTALIFGVQGQRLEKVDSLSPWIDGNRFFLWDHFGDEENGLYAVYLQAGFDIKLMTRALCLSVIWGLENKG